MMKITWHESGFDLSRCTVVSLLVVCAALNGLLEGEKCLYVQVNFGQPKITNSSPEGAYLYLSSATCVHSIICSLPSRMLG